MKSFTSYVLADADWMYLNDDEGIEFRFDSIEEARGELAHASLTTDIPEDHIVILKETREEVI